MPGKPMADRTYDLFLSHAHEDKPTHADRLNGWCRRAGMLPFYDTVDMVGRLQERIVAAVDASRAGVVCLSKSSLKSDYCTEEWRLFKEEVIGTPDFALVTLRLDDTPVPRELEKRRWIDISASGLDGRTATELLEALYAPAVQTSKWNYKPIYFSRGSRPREVEAAAAITAELGKRQLRVSRDDSVNTEDSLVTRVRRIMQGCYGVAALITDRGGKSSPYILLEILVAIEEGLPLLVVIEQGLTDEILAAEFNRFVQDLVLSKTPERDAYRYRDLAERLAHAILEGGIGALGKHVVRLQLGRDDQLRDQCLDDFCDELRTAPKKPAQCFFGHSYDEAGRSQKYEFARRALQAVSGIPCKAGDDFRADRPGMMQQPRIIEAISTATFAVFDISERDGKTPINTCIETGIALGAGVPIYLVARGIERETRPDKAFMLADYHIHYYADDADLMAIMRKIGRLYRRVTE